MLILPEQIQQKSAEKKTLVLGGATLIDYCQDYSQPVYEACLTQHLLAFVLGGEKQIHVGGEILHLQAGESFFLRRGEYAMSEMTAEAGLFSNVLFFLEPALISEFLGAGRIPSSVVPPVFRIVVTPLVRNFIQSLPLFLADPLSGSAALVRCKLMELLHYLAESPENPGFRAYLQQLNQPGNNDLVAFMARHGDAHHDLAQLARLSGRSLATFKRDFSSVFGEPPGGWLRRRRLGKAYSLLCAGQKNVTEVCLEVGYDSLSHFISAFRQQYGVTPKALSQKSPQSS